MSTAQLAAEFGRSDEYVREMVKKGMPRASHGKYDLELCKSWYIKWLQEKLNHGGDDHKPEDPDAISSERERALLTKAQREKAEHDLAVVRGEYVPIKTYERTMGAQVAQARQLLLTLPARIAHELEGQPRPVIKDILIKRIHAGLLALSKGEKLDGTDATPIAGS